MKNGSIRYLLIGALLGTGPAAHVLAAPSRGELLYTTHCISCHTAQIHWRDGRLAKDWNSLLVNVRRWQGNTGLGWSEADIAEVARHLDETIYHYRQAPDRVSLPPPSTAHSTRTHLKKAEHESQ